MNLDEYSNCEPDKIVLTNPNRTLQVLNESYSGARCVLWCRLQAGWILPGRAACVGVAHELGQAAGWSQAVGFWPEDGETLQAQRGEAGLFFRSSECTI